MTWEVGSTDQQRVRAGLAVLILGVAILLFTWTLSAIRGPQTEGEMAVRREKIEPPPTGRILPLRMAGPMLVYGVVLIVVLVTSIVAFLRISRHYREQLLRRPRRPTETADVWQMHKVPELPDDEAPGESDEDRPTDGDA